MNNNPNITHLNKETIALSNSADSTSTSPPFAQTTSFPLRGHIQSAYILLLMQGLPSVKVEVGTGEG